ncbi:hypothetical protein [Streptomyces luteogriseus]|nr:hypothetical protein [Streptomyces luteogriseus]WTJ27337.1 hypothetical protein OID52_09810 [Streptomyces luteogriseus]
MADDSTADEKDGPVRAGRRRRITGGKIDHPTADEVAVELARQQPGRG